MTQSRKCIAAVVWCWQAGKEAASHCFHKALDGLKCLYFLHCQYVGLKLTAKLGDVCSRFTVPQLQTFFYLRNSLCSLFCYQLLPSFKDPLSNLVPLCSPLWFTRTFPAVFSHFTQIPASCVCCLDRSFSPVLVKYHSMAFWTFLMHGRNK